MKNQILAYLPSCHPWREGVEFFPELPSTNDLLKKLARQGASEGTAVFADRQTDGHGRRGRSFHSPGGMGVYASILLEPNCAPTELMHLTCAVAEAMCDAVEAAAGFRPGIKWTNDLVYEKRKLGGILTELILTPLGRVSHAVVGIGINCSQSSADFPEDIRSFAGSLTMAAGKPVDRARLAAAMIEALHAVSHRLLPEKDAIMTQYRRDCITLGQDISILRGDFVSHGRALDVNTDGALVVLQENGSIETVNSGEVSIRGMYHYL